MIISRLKQRLSNLRRGVYQAFQLLAAVCVFGTVAGVMGLLAADTATPERASSSVVISRPIGLPVVELPKVAYLPIIGAQLEDLAPPVRSGADNRQPFGAYFPEVTLSPTPTITPQPTATPLPTATPQPTRASLPTAVPPPVQVEVVVAPDELDQPLPEISLQQPSATPQPTRVAAAPSGNDCAPGGNPVSGVFMQGFNTLHPGIDLGVPNGTPVIATHSGAVDFADWSYIGYGYLVIVRSGTFSSYYGHLSAFNVSGGQQVQRGQVIGWTGTTGNSSGPHLHYETRLNGNAIDPAEFATYGYPVC